MDSVHAAGPDRFHDRFARSSAGQDGEGKDADYRNRLCIQISHLIAWRKTFGARWLLLAVREQHLEPVSETACQYHNTDRLTGMLVPLVFLCRGGVSRALREQVLALSAFASLDHFDGRTVADYVLRGELLRLEQVDHGGDVRAAVKISLELVESPTARVVWAGVRKRSTLRGGRSQRRRRAGDPAALRRTGPSSVPAFVELSKCRAAAARRGRRDGGGGAPQRMVRVGVSCAGALDCASESSIHCPAGERTDGEPSIAPTGDVGLAESRRFRPPDALGYESREGANLLISAGAV